MYSPGLGQKMVELLYSITYFIYIQMTQKRGITWPHKCQRKWMN